MHRLRATASVLLGYVMVAHAMAATGLELTYLQRLRLPVSSDDIGYGQSVTLDPETGEVFVCDPRSNRILIFDADGYFDSQILGGIDFSNPRDIAVHPDGYLFLLASRGPRTLPIELDFDGEFVREIELLPDSDELREARFVSIATTRDGETLYLMDDHHRAIWIARRSGEVTRKIDLASLMGAKEGQDIFVGQLDVYGEHLVVAIPSHGEIQKYDLAGHLIDRIGIKGVGACKLGRPMAAALTDRGDYLIVDQQRMLLIHWSATGNRCLGEYIGIGDAPGFLYYPNDLAVDREGILYIAQSYDGRVQRYAFSATDPTSGAGASRSDPPQPPR